MAKTKYISLDNLRRFKEKQDQEISSKAAVSANPELTGNEDSLTGIEIDGTKYRAGLTLVELSGESGTIASGLLSKIVAGPQNYVLKLNVQGSPSLFYNSNGTTYVYAYITATGITKYYVSINVNNGNWTLSNTTSHDSTKEDVLGFNVTPPQGTEPTTLSIIKDGDNYWRIPEGGISEAVWGEIHGTLSQQTDLQTALNNKANVSQIPTNVSQLTNDSGYINSVKTVNGTSVSGSGNIDTTPTDMTELEVRRMFRSEVTITTTVTHGTYTGDTESWTKEGGNVQVTADLDYKLPDSITVTNATFTYNSTTGAIALSNIKDNVVITVVCELLPSLDAPTISLSSDILTITEVTNAEGYEIYADGVKKTTYYPE